MSKEPVIVGSCFTILIQPRTVMDLFCISIGMVMSPNVKVCWTPLTFQPPSISLPKQRMGWLIWSLSATVSFSTQLHVHACPWDATPRLSCHEVVCCCLVHPLGYQAKHLQRFQVLWWTLETLRCQHLSQGGFMAQLVHNVPTRHALLQKTALTNTRRHKSLTLTKVTRYEKVHNLSSNSPFLLILPFDITHFLFSGTNQLNQ